MNGFNLSDVSHTEKDSEHEKVIHKRRSSVFQSRVVVFDEDREKEVDINDATGCASKVPQEEIFNLEEYVNSLKNERMEWIETYKRRKIERKNLAKQKLRLENEEQLLDLNILSESEKAFVMARPKYQHICKSANKLSEIALKVSVLNHMVYKVNQRFLLQMENRLRNVTEKIIETSES